VVLLALCVVMSLVGAACGSASSGTVEADGPEVVRFAFEGSPSGADQKRTVEVLNTRFDAAGVDARAALVDGAVVVRASGTPAPSADHITALAQPGSLQFRPVMEVHPPDDGTGSTTVTTNTTATSSVDPGAAVEMPELDANGTVVARYDLGPTLVDGSALERAASGQNQKGQWEIRPVFKEGADGIVKFNAAAALCNPPSDSCPTGQIAVALDGRVITAPTIQVASFERDQITISGSYTRDEARTVAALLDSGSLPAALRVVGG